METVKRLRMKMKILRIRTVEIRISDLETERRFVNNMFLNKLKSRSTDTPQAKLGFKSQPAFRYSEFTFIIDFQ